MSRPIPSCTECQDLLPLHVGGDLEPEVERAVRAHLEGCADCRLALAAAEQARGLVCQALDRSASDEAFQNRPDPWPGIRARLLAEGLLSPSTRRSGGAVSAAGPVAVPQAGRPGDPTGVAKRGLLRRLRPVSAAAAAVLAVLLVRSALESGGPTPSVAPLTVPEQVAPAAVAAVTPAEDPSALAVSSGARPEGEASLGGLVRVPPGEHRRPEAVAEEAVDPRWIRVPSPNLWPTSEGGPRFASYR